MKAPATHGGGKPPHVPRLTRPDTPMALRPTMVPPAPIKEEEVIKAEEPTVKMPDGWFDQFHLHTAPPPPIGEEDA